MPRSTLELTPGIPAPKLHVTTHRSLSFDGSGRLHLCWVNLDGTLVIEDFEGPRRTLPRGLKFPLVQRFSDGRWLIVESRARPNHKNAAIYDPNLTKLTAFEVGDAVEAVLIDQSDQIWIGYFDENPQGLKRFSQTGAVEYDFNRSSGLGIFDLYAMTMDATGALWVYQYTEFFLAKLANDTATRVLEQAPVQGANAIAVGGNHGAFFGAHKEHDVTLCDLRTQSTTLITLTVEGTPIGWSEIATHGEKIALLWNAKLYRLELNDLISCATRKQ